MANARRTVFWVLLLSCLGTAVYIGFVHPQTISHRMSVMLRETAFFERTRTFEEKIGQGDIEAIDILIGFLTTNDEYNFNKKRGLDLFKTYVKLPSKNAINIYNPEECVSWLGSHKTQLRVDTQSQKILVVEADDNNAVPVQQPFTGPKEGIAPSQEPEPPPQADGGKEGNR